MIDKIIKSIKGPNYSIDKNVKSFSKSLIVIERLFMVIRGIFFQTFRSKSKGLLFISKNVKIKYGKKIKFGKNCSIHRNCYINALVKGNIIIGDNFSLGMNSIIEGFGVLSNIGEGMKIGNNVGISPNSFISIRGKVVVGDNTIIGPYFSIHPENHVFKNKSVLIRKQGVTREGIKIGSNCWLGAKVTILDGVELGDNCVVAAGAVITKSFPNNSLIGGVPAKIIYKLNGEKNENNDGK